MTQWWDVFADAGGLEELETWLGGVDARSRARVRQRIAECRYTTILDCGAGLGIDWLGMANIAHPVEYTGMEPSSSLREAAARMARAFMREEDVPLVDGHIEAIPFPDASFDLVYARHIFEHLPRIDKPLQEMVRVAKLEVVVIFFMRPGREAYLTREHDGLWQNRWAKEDIEKTLRAEPRAEVWFWETLGSEVLLHVYMQESREVDADLVAARVKIDDPEPDPE